MIKESSAIFIALTIVLSIVEKSFIFNNLNKNEIHVYFLFCLLFGASMNLFKIMWKDIKRQSNEIKRLKDEDRD